MLARAFLLMWYTNMMPRIEQAGHAIRQGFRETRLKRDNSPVTDADMKSHAVIDHTWELLSTPGLTQPQQQKLWRTDSQLERPWTNDMQELVDGYDCEWGIKMDDLAEYREARAKRRIEAASKGRRQRRRLQHRQRRPQPPAWQVFPRETSVRRR